MFSKAFIAFAVLLGLVSAASQVYNIDKFSQEARRFRRFVCENQVIPFLGVACGARKNVRRTDIKAVLDTTGAGTLSFYGLNNADTLDAAISDKANIPLVSKLTSGSTSVSVKTYLKVQRRENLVDEEGRPDDRFYLHRANDRCRKKFHYLTTVVKAGNFRRIPDVFMSAMSQVEIKILHRLWHKCTL
ncbi:unnamed protein product, partial [Mesorhabditis spiculigera]